MSSGLQNKLYNYEVAPPSAVWVEIASELDQSLLSHKFPSILRNTQVAPASHIWQNISAAIDEPVLVNDYSTKLAGIEVVPPVTAWDKIKATLSAENEAASPVRRIFYPFLKYAAAAIIIGFMAWGGILIFNTNKTENTSLARNENTSPVKNNETVSVKELLNKQIENIAIPDIAASIEEARNDAALEESKKTFAKLDVSTTHSKIKNAANFFFVADDYEYSPTTSTRGISIGSNETPSIDVSKRYIMLMTPDGNIIRMSKKLKELVCCVSGEDQDRECIDQLKKWRKQVGHPATSHSASNFMDILSLMNSMQDN